LAGHVDAHRSGSPDQELLRAGKDHFSEAPRPATGPVHFCNSAEVSEKRCSAIPSEVGGKLQFGVNAEQRTARWDFRAEIADETVPGADLDMTDATSGPIHEHRADRRGERICYRQSLESIVTDEFRCCVSGKFGFRPGIDNTGSKQCVFYVMPASRARMRMGAFLCDRCCLRESAVDVPIDLAVRVNNLLGIILRDDRNGLFFALRSFEAETETRPFRRAGCLLTHWSHWLYRKSSPRLFGDCLRRFLGDRTRRLFRHRLRRLLGDCLRRLLLDRLCRLLRGHRCSLFRDRFYGLIRGRLCRLLRDHLNHVVRVLLVVAREIQR
jgi:hypothetical protein